MRGLLLIFSLLGCLFFSRCAKVNECPEPKIVTDTATIRTVLRPGTEGKDAHTTTSNPAVPHDQTHLAISSWTISGIPEVSRSYMDFDYSFIPQGAKVTKATLTLFADTTNLSYGGHSTLSGPNNWIIKRVTSPWQEATLIVSNAPTTDNVHQIFMPTSTSKSQSYIIDITEFVKDELSNPSAFHGIMMQLVTESPYRMILFCSSDHIYPQLHPKLEVEFTK